jgi:hypothetical protein
MELVIKFRGKSQIDGKWVYGSLLQDSENNCAIILTPSCIIEPLTVIPVYSDTVGQETDFYDENGTYVYEDDIINSFGVNYRVERKNDSGFGFFGPCTYPGYIYYKIIGNIHDNPELIESTKSIDEKINDEEY